jgi:hypothetical protein
MNAQFSLYYRKGMIVLLISWECFESGERRLGHSTHDGYHWMHPSATIHTTSTYYVVQRTSTYQSLPHLQDIVSVRAAAGSN